MSKEDMKELDLKAVGECFVSIITAIYKVPARCRWTVLKTVYELTKEEAVKPDGGSNG